jgi:adenosylmethionine-8-amino-7-oxononanoate aminotransferase
MGSLNPIFSLNLVQRLGQRSVHRSLKCGLLTRFDSHWWALGRPLIMIAEQIDEVVLILDRSTAEVLAA